MKSEDIMSTKTRRSYTEAFKEETVRFVWESGHPVAQVLGIWVLRTISSTGARAPP